MKYIAKNYLCTILSLSVHGTLVDKTFVCQHVKAAMILALTQQNGRCCIAHRFVSISKVRALADRYGLSVHMDGARVMNAAVAMGLPPSTILQHTHTVSVCLSKVGLQNTNTHSGHINLHFVY